MNIHRYIPLIQSNHKPYHISDSIPSCTKNVMEPTLAMNALTDFEASSSMNSSISMRLETLCTVLESKNRIM